MSGFTKAAPNSAGFERRHLSAGNPLTFIEARLICEAREEEARMILADPDGLTVGHAPSLPHVQEYFWAWLRLVLLGAVLVWHPVWHAV